jgi:hypothetical protein
LESVSTADSAGGCIRSGPAEGATQPIRRYLDGGRLALCLAPFLQLSEFKPRAVRSLKRRVTEPIDEIPQWDCVEIFLTADLVILNNSLELGRFVGWKFMQGEAS